MEVLTVMQEMAVVVLLLLLTPDPKLAGEEPYPPLATTPYTHSPQLEPSPLQANSMAHFAELDNNNIVLRVIVVPNSEEAHGCEWCASLLGGRWLQTSYNATIRGKFAGIGDQYDPISNTFCTTLTPPNP